MFYPVVYLDPPWDFETHSGGGHIPTRKSEQDYPTLTTEAMKELPLHSVVARNSACFMWVTDSHLKQGIELLEALGFRYSSIAFYWLKTTRGFGNSVKKKSKMPTRSYRVCRRAGWHFGMGYRTRANPEIVLVGNHGKGVPVRNHGIPKLVVAPVARHSEKPEIVRQYIERLHAGPYLELFGRQVADGWTVLGNEIDGLDIREALDQLGKDIYVRMVA